jgi:5-methylcytosine-specific restriction endonuclease McrA
LSAGGADELSNCQFLCKACHERVHNTTDELGRI